jgi:hypothetical protein
MLASVKRRTAFKVIAGSLGLLAILAAALFVAALRMVAEGEAHNLRHVPASTLE